MKGDPPLSLPDQSAFALLSVSIETSEIGTAKVATMALVNHDRWQRLRIGADVSSDHQVTAAM